MHLLAAQAGALQAEGEAIDLCQTPADIVFTGAADSELAMLAAATDRAGFAGLRLANLMRLSHNLSVDLWLDETVRHAKLVVVRLIGGISYWQYGVDELLSLAMAGTIRLVLLPGDATPDPLLRDKSSIAPDDWTRLHQLFVAGGPDNADAILVALRQLAAAPRGTAVLGDLAVAPFARFGFWYPGHGMLEADAMATLHRPGRPVAPLLFYRAALEGAGTATLEALIAECERQGLNPLPMVVSTLKEAACVRFVRAAFVRFAPAVILNLTGFALGLDGLDDKHNPFAGTDAPVLQMVQAGRPAAQYEADPQGLSAKDLAMLVVLPELDGRIGGLIVGHKEADTWHAGTECPLASYAPDHSGVARAVRLAANWARLRRLTNADKRIGLVLANYPLRDGRLANGVGYDAPQSTVEILRLLAGEGCDTVDVPSAAHLIDLLQAGPTNANPQRGTGQPFSLARYRELFATLPPKVQADVTERWGDPATDPFVRGDTFHLPVVTVGKVAILLQPARAYDGDPTLAFHDPVLVPPHAYLAAYLWLQHEWRADALIHNGKHGNLEWLPGKATALDIASYPDLLWGQLPHLYPFIVNDPGEGTQAKRRTGAVIIDHLVPPLTRAESYGPLKDLEALLDEYYAALGMDRRRLADLRRRILDLSRDMRLDRDIGLPPDETEALKLIDNHLCELKERQIRDGLHVFGQSPTGRLERDLALALARSPRGENPGDASLIRALADDLKLGLDPLIAPLAEPWTGPLPHPLPPCRTVGALVEALEELAAALLDGQTPQPDWTATAAVLATVQTVIRPKLTQSGPNEAKALLDGLCGRFVPPGPSGAPSRGRLDVLPTGRNFYSIDNRAVPTPTAWELGRKSAEALCRRHFQDQGDYLRAVALSVWGTAAMRTGGDDIAQALALIGAKPVWEPASLRVSGYEILPLAKLDRPRVDVTLRISGLFRDAFPNQIALFDRAVRAIGALDEPEDLNPIAARMRSDALQLMADGTSEAEAALKAGHRIFGSKPGAYGSGLDAMLASGTWQARADFADAVLVHGQFAFGAHVHGVPERARFAARLASVDAVIHNQDNREHDLLDSDQYVQFQGGLLAAAEALSGRKPAAYHLDHTRPENPVPRTLDEEIALIVRSRVVNPKWLAGVKRHGYRGAFEIIATLDLMAAFAATTGAVKSHQFDLAFEAFVEDATTRDFIAAANRFGYSELLARFRDLIARGLWQPRSNSAYALLEEAA